MKRVNEKIYCEVSFCYLIGIEKRSGYVITHWWNDFYKRFERILYDDLISEYKEKVAIYLYIKTSLARYSH